MKTRSGLTLVELLIASGIFLAVAVTIYSSFYTGIFGYRNIEEAQETYQSAMQILERINLDLRNSFAYSKEGSGFIGTNDSVTFLTLVDTFYLDRILPDYAYVYYALDGGNLTRLCLKNKEAQNPNAVRAPDFLNSNIEELSFSYGYIPQGSEELEWQDSWINQKALPIAVRVRLTIKDKQKASFDRLIYLPSAEL